ncbi:hypothetical protein T01_10955 [Trichinella spiralis]|uniref:Uncharacterized protein n=1 Tax=Trichinella spiralis TaxID=6334 RepID=A0A0V1BRA4_TRISP|nr:hypothetical protein T01_10955 [Trichinella spiralis]
MWFRNEWRSLAAYGQSVHWKNVVQLTPLSNCNPETALTPDVDGWSIPLTDAPSAVEMTSSVDDDALGHRSGESTLATTTERVFSCVNSTMPDQGRKAIGLIAAHGTSAGLDRSGRQWDLLVLFWTFLADELDHLIFAHHSQPPVLLFIGRSSSSSSSTSSSTNSSASSCCARGSPPSLAAAAAGSAASVGVPLGKVVGDSEPALLLSLLCRCSCSTTIGDRAASGKVTDKGNSGIGGGGEDGDGDSATVSGDSAARAASAAAIVDAFDETSSFASSTTVGVISTDTSLLLSTTIVVISLPVNKYPKQTNKQIISNNNNNNNITRVNNNKSRPAQKQLSSHKEKEEEEEDKNAQLDASEQKSDADDKRTDCCRVKSDGQRSPDNRTTGRLDLFQQRCVDGDNNAAPPYGGRTPEVDVVDQ